MFRKRVTYEEATILKELGFDKDVDLAYNVDNIQNPIKIEPPINANIGEGVFSAPTLNDVRDWIEETYTIIVETRWNDENRCFDAWFKEINGRSMRISGIPLYRENALDAIIYLALKEIKRAGYYSKRAK